MFESRFGLGKIGPDESFTISLLIAGTLIALYPRMPIPAPGSRGAFYFGSFVIVISGIYAVLYTVQHPNQQHIGRGGYMGGWVLLMILGSFIRGDAYKGQSS